MSFSILAPTSLLASDLPVENVDSRFRKATVNMTMAALACEKTLSSLPVTDKNQISFVLGTHFGEVTSTLDFLRSYHETKTPSPILFQNSLHNSTLGFATIHLGLTGPALTVSADKLTIPSALETAQTLLEITPYVLVCLVDYIPAQLKPHYLARFPFMEKNWNRAFCCALARPELIEAENLTTHKFEDVF